MYPYISRSDCYYTDTDSVILSEPLPDEKVSSSELGKFKLEYKVKEGILLAPKSYCLILEEGKKDIKVHKGATKSKVTREWYIEQYENMAMTKKVVVTNSFRVERKSLTFEEKSSSHTLSLPEATKRDRVLSGSPQKWIDTSPIELNYQIEGDVESPPKHYMRNSKIK